MGDDQDPPLADRLRPYVRSEQAAPPPGVPAAAPSVLDDDALVAVPAPVSPPAPTPPTAAGAAMPANAPPASRATTAEAFRDDVLLKQRPSPPRSGWRWAVHTLTAGAVSPGPNAAEVARRQLMERVRTPVQGCRRIAVISRKGGVGKTTTTLMLGHTFAVQRGDRVVALDGNPDAGSLGYRVRRDSEATITDLLARAGDLRRYADVRAVTSQAPSRLEVIASDDDPQISQAIGEREYGAAVALLEHHYNLILLDSGTGILHSATQGILRVADHLVVVMAPSIDGSRAASLTLDWLDSHDYGDLVSGAVAVINESREKGGLVEIERVAQHFRARCRDVIQIPWDPHLEAGARSDIDQLRPPTREAYLRLAGAVADGFAGGTMPV